MAVLHGAFLGLGKGQHPRYLSSAAHRGLRLNRVERRCLWLRPKASFDSRWLRRTAKAANTDFGPEARISVDWARRPCHFRPRCNRYEHVRGVGNVGPKSPPLMRVLDPAGPIVSSLAPLKIVSLPRSRRNVPRGFGCGSVSGAGSGAGGLRRGVRYGCCAISSPSAESGLVSTGDAASFGGFCRGRIVIATVRGHRHEARQPILADPGNIQAKNGDLQPGGKSSPVRRIEPGLGLMPSCVTPGADYSASARNTAPPIAPLCLPRLE